MKPTLIYANDPLCGWCYGFHPIMKRLHNRFNDDLNLKVIPGGLATGENAQKIAEGYDYILNALERVEDTTGIEFGKNFKLLAEEGSYYYDSEPSCRIQNVVNELNPDKSLEFAGSLHQAIFVDGDNLNEWETFETLLEGHSVDISKARQLYESDEIKIQTEENFEWCAKNGATAFPTLLLQIGDEIGVMSRGYRPYDILESHLHHLLNNIKKVQD
ncbi:DsbA family protein [Rhodohalobacter sulfatireducens]|uniref:DsbA family protein n=1 Tax=Rhodohalobacter sulfatireducens TaxID=2911366 RepID=A0ABS9KAK8_9BACT|nr:DsbA family protein [Rhodohalobacter sulfatireducens]MCG2587890.1 DsbA family protein [Rhodohalobacter sulfatireducens]